MFATLMLFDLVKTGVFAYRATLPCVTRAQYKLQNIQSGSGACFT